MFIELRRKTPQLGENTALFSRDLAPKTISFENQDDDGVKTLHEARFLRLLLSNLLDWWKNVPLTGTSLIQECSIEVHGS